MSHNFQATLKPNWYKSQATAQLKTNHLDLKALGLEGMYDWVAAFTGKLEGGSS